LLWLGVHRVRHAARRRTPSEMPSEMPRRRDLTCQVTSSVCDMSTWVRSHVLSLLRGRARVFVLCHRLRQRLCAWLREPLIRRPEKDSLKEFSSEFFTAQVHDCYCARLFVLRARQIKVPFSEAFPSGLQKIMPKTVFSAWNLLDPIMGCLRGQKSHSQRVAETA